MPTAVVAVLCPNNSYIARSPVTAFLHGPQCVQTSPAPCIQSHLASALACCPACDTSDRAAPTAASAQLNSNVLSAASMPLRGDVHGCMALLPCGWRRMIVMRVAMGLRCAALLQGRCMLLKQRVALRCGACLAPGLPLLLLIALCPFLRWEAEGVGGRRTQALSGEGARAKARMHGS